MNKRLSISDDQAVELAELFRLMGDASRLKIVLACLQKPQCVSTIAATTHLSPSLVSHHLRLLRATRMLRGERRGKQVFYVATDAHVQCVITDMVAHITESEAADS
ncbi:MAG: winged helix-turn-helix transcriptional regulator [Proteobacteria bacterium]|nr:winged helix-turn-helix transcriptional regulator [Pseudomonadota bacterium]